MKKSFLNHSLWLAAAVLLLLTVVQSRSELPPDAQEAVDKGVIAAKQQEWEIAIKSFQEARKLAPNAPEVFYNLGLAESKIPGRELRAISWFAAYLAVIPNAPNAAKVEAKIKELDETSKNNIYRLIGKMQNLANELNYRLDPVADLWAHAGNADEAIQISKSVADDAKVRIAESLADIGQFENAKSLIAGIKPSSKTQFAGVAKHLAFRGDVNGAEAILTQIWNGQHSALSDLNLDAVETSEMIKALAVVGAAQHRTGHNEAAMASFSSAIFIVKQIKDDEYHLEHGEYEMIARIEADLGMFEEAHKTANLIPRKDPDHHREHAEIYIAEAQIDIGHIAEARKTEALIYDDESLKKLEKRIAELTNAPEANLRLSGNDVPRGTKVSDWIERLEDDDDYGYFMLNSEHYWYDETESKPLDYYHHGKTIHCALNKSIFLNQAGRLKSISTSRPDDYFTYLRAAVAEMVDAKNIVDQMLKQQAKQQAKP
jgi:tetratricopeptide (TPR) repeat protein